MAATLQSKKAFTNNNSYYGIVAPERLNHLITSVYNMQDEIVDLEKLVTVVQIVVQQTQLEVIVTDHDQSAVIFNRDQVHM